MSDSIDEAQSNVLYESESLLVEARLAAASIPKGNPGECNDCGYHSPRLVGGVCAPCRDDFKQP